MIIESITVGMYETNCYGIINEQTKEGLIIDPGSDTQRIVNLIEKMKFKPRAILLTHGHMDHTGAVSDLCKLYDMEVYINKNDFQMIKNSEYIFGKLPKDRECKFIEDEDELDIGGLSVKCIATPGHSPGGMSFLINNAVFCGDTLFSRSIGRTDFSGGNYESLLSSVKNKLFTLDESTIAYPGHGPKTTIGYEKNNNPFF